MTSSRRYIASFPDLRSWRRAAVGQVVCGAVWCQCAVVIIPYITFSTVYSGHRVQLSCHVRIYYVITCPPIG